MRISSAGRLVPVELAAEEIAGTRSELWAGRVLPGRAPDRGAS